MKFSFSTLACPDYTWADIYSMAKDLGFDGIEVRGLGNDIFDASKNMPFSPRLLPATKQKLRALRLTIPCLSSGCCLRDGATVETVAEVRAYIEAAESIGTPYVRVLGDLNRRARRRRGRRSGAGRAARAAPLRRGKGRDAAGRDQRRIFRHRAPARAA